MIAEWRLAIQNTQWEKPKILHNDEHKSNGKQTSQSEGPKK